ncbi:MAG: GNAT family N-acetyltransferase [Chloroflexi bacterium]|nr:GNAT family N-acetyltransferase [Chloroflexota bacterium]
MADEIIIRRCSEADIESVLELWRVADATASVTDTSQDLRAVVDSELSSILIAESGGRIVGSIIGAFNGWRGNIYRLAVHPDQRRRGIARRLLSEVEEWLRGQGAKRVGAVVEKDHPWATGFWDSTEFQLEPLDLRYVRDL